jgi:HK97 gp10 family phage protein
VALTFKLTGADKIIDRMSKFPVKLQEAASRRSVRRAMIPVRKAAQAAAKQFDDPQTGDRIWKNLYLQTSRRQSKRVGGVVMRLGVLGGANLRREGPSGTYTPGGDTRHWSAARELGTETIPARPFLRPALESRALEVANTLVSELNKELDKLAAAA